METLRGKILFLIYTCVSECVDGETQLITYSSNFHFVKTLQIIEVLSKKKKEIL